MVTSSAVYSDKPLQRTTQQAFALTNRAVIIQIYHAKLVENCWHVVAELG